MSGLKQIVVLLLSLAGLASIVKMIVMLLCGRGKKECTLVVPIKQSENAEEIIRDKAMNMSWSERNTYNRIYCIGNGLDDEAEEICKKICGEYKNTEYFDINKFEKSRFFDE